MGWLELRFAGIWLGLFQQKKKVISTFKLEICVIFKLQIYVLITIGMQFTVG